ITGSVTAISGSTITVQGAHGAIYMVNAGNATVAGHANTALSLSSIKIGDKVSVTGTLSGSMVVATKVHDLSDLTGKVFRSLEAGVVTAINGSQVTIANFGKAGSTIVTTNSGTQYSLNGTAASSSALSVGSSVFILGTSTATSTNATINAKIVLIITEG